MSRIDFHADDYGLSPNASEDILKCLRAGRLNSISVLTNMSCFLKYAEQYNKEQREWPKKPLLSVHLNFMEGHCQASREQVPHLVNERGHFKSSWGSLFVWNYSPRKRQTIKNELKAEIKAQTERFLDYFGRELPLRFDGHQHTQMIPIVYRALTEVIEEEQYRTEYIRVSKEPMLPFLKVFSLWRTYSPVNWIKNILLNLYSLRMEKVIPVKERMLLWGIVMSGHMDEGRIKKIAPHMKQYADKRGRTLEILFHPGTTLPEEMGEEFSNEGTGAFYLSEGRHIEYEAVMSLAQENLQ